MKNSMTLLSPVLISAVTAIPGLRGIIHLLLKPCRPNGSISHLPPYLLLFFISRK
ncbi:MAG: hypothetical protein KG012_01435 [Deltaproteobacteria bacterium]|nr:hypothetical protein [Deltaproteobacteria bacterium]